MSSRIEQIIEEIEEYVDSCKFQPLSSTKIVVNKEELEELLRELRMKTPDEIKRYQKIISNKDAILSDAQAKADAIIQEAKEQTQKMVDESEVMREAIAQSNDLLEIFHHLCQNGKKNHISSYFQEGICCVVDTGIQKSEIQLDLGCFFF